MADEAGKPRVIKSLCGTCEGDTSQTILFQSVDPGPYEYHLETAYQVLECCGCQTKSFRKCVSDYESAVQIAENEWEVDREINLYPSALHGHREIPEIYDVPKVVSAIYRQSLEAICNNAGILAGMGLRATVEAICNEQAIAGRTLEKRIDSLAKTGLISAKDAGRLHAIRFMGNDAAHDVQPTDKQSLSIALRIVEHLIVSLYVLDQAAEGILETIIEKYGDFETMLSSKVATLTSGDELPLPNILGKDSRRFHGHLKGHEATLISNIASGAYSKLTLGKLANFSGSKEKFQHFVVV